VEVRDINGDTASILFTPEASAFPYATLTQGATVFVRYAAKCYFSDLMTQVRGGGAVWGGVAGGERGAGQGGTGCCSVQKQGTAPLQVKKGLLRSSGAGMVAAACAPTLLLPCLLQCRCQGVRTMCAVCCLCVAPHPGAQGG
jgi:hypothetical protein